MATDLDMSKSNSDLSADISDCVKALNDCVKHASDHYGLNITDIAMSMQETTKWSLFKWVESGRMPISEVAKFEDICHARFVTLYLADRAGLLVLPKSKGLENPRATLLGANKAMAEAISHAANHIDGKAQSKPAIKAIDVAMESLASLRRQITHD